MKKQSLLLSVLFFAVGFMMMNGTHNFIAVLFIFLLLYVFVLVPLFYRIKFLLKDLSNMIPSQNEWA